MVVDTVMHDYDSLNQKDSLGVTLGASYDFEVVKLFAMAQYGEHENAFGNKTSVINEGAAKATTDTAYKADYVKVLSDKGWKGYGVSLGATAPVLGGTVLAQANYLDAKATDVNYESANEGDAAAAPGTLDKLKAQNWGVALGYTYPFSKRTNVYTYVSYAELKIKATDDEGTDTVKTKQTEFGLGLKHTF